MPLRQRQEVQEVLRRPGGSLTMLDDLIRDINTLREKVAELGGHL